MSFPKKLFLRSIFVLVIVAGVWAFISVVSLYFTFHDPSKYLVVMLLLVGCGIYPLVTKLVDWVDLKIDPTISKNIKNAHNGRRGYEGEDTVNGWLEEIVGDGNIIRNVSFVGRYGHKFDIDLVLVSSKGVVAIEVKNFTDPVRFEGDEYFQMKGDKKIPVSPDDDPRFEVVRHAFALRKRLNENGFEKVKITRVVAFANGLVSWDGKTGVYIAKDKDSLKNCIDGLEVDSNYSVEDCEKIKALLFG